MHVPVLKDNMDVISPPTKRKRTALQIFKTQYTSPEAFKSEQLHLHSNTPTLLARKHREHTNACPTHIADKLYLLR